MTDAKFEKQKARIEALFEKWSAPLGLNWWRVALRYNREGWKASEAQQNENWAPVARVNASWEYRQAQIEWNMPELDGISDERLEEHFVHECAHILVREMREWADHPHDNALSHEERVVSTLACAFLWVREAGKNDTPPTPAKVVQIPVPA